MASKLPPPPDRGGPKISIFKAVGLKDPYRTARDVGAKAAVKAMPATTPRGGSNRGAPASRPKGKF